VTRTLIRGGCVLTMGRANHPVADVLIEDDRIAEVGPGLRARDATVVDASDHIVMPGFVDAHQHVSDSLLRHTGSSGPVPRNFYDAADLYTATLVGLLAAIESGTTTVADWSPLAGSAEELEAVLTAHEESGIRSVVVHPIGGDAGDSRRALVQLAGRSGRRLSPAAGVEGSGVGGNGTAAWDMARQLRLPVHVHALPGGGAAALRGRGLLGAGTVLIECSSLDESDLDAIAASGASLVVTPARQMIAGLGTPPVQGLIDRGIRPGLGVASVIETPGDLFAQMRSVISIQHAELFDRKLLGKGGVPKLLTTREVIRHATSDGAAAIGLGAHTGAIEPGMQADLILLATDRPNIHPINDPIGAVVWGMDTSNVEWVFVAGRAVKRHGQLTADVAWVRAAAADARDRLGAAVAVDSEISP